MVNIKINNNNIQIDLDMNNSYKKLGKLGGESYTFIVMRRRNGKKHVMETTFVIKTARKFYFL